MIAKKLIMASLLCFVGSTGFADINDWNGTFTIRHNNGTIQTVTHTPAYVQYLFIYSGECTVLGKGVSINGIKFQDNIRLCTHSTVEKFTDEVQKMGLIVNKRIALGSTYHN